MNTARIHSLRSRVDDAFDAGKGLRDEMQSHWSRYLCVLVSGYLEASVRILYSEYAKDKSSPKVSNFVESQMRDLRNPKMEILLQWTRLFDPIWAESLDAATRERLKTSVDSVVNVRHQIAHGESTGISFSTISQYYRDVVEVVKLIEAQCKAG